MITITVCVGSSCHIRGAREIIRLYSELIERGGLKDRVELKGSFCMDRCTEGVNIRIGDELFSVAGVEAAERIFSEKVSSALRASTKDSIAEKTRGVENDSEVKGEDRLPGGGS